MPTLLQITVSPRGDYSISRRLGEAAVQAWKDTNPGGRVIERDLAKTPLTFVDVDWIAGAFSPPERHNENHKKALALSDDLVAELLEAPRPVIGDRTGLHPDQAGRQLRHEDAQLPAAERLAQHRLPPRIDAVHPEVVLCQINSQRCNLHCGPSSLRLVSLERAFLAHRGRYPSGERSIPSMLNTCEALSRARPRTPQRTPHMSWKRHRLGRVERCLRTCCQPRHKRCIALRLNTEADS